MISMFGFAILVLSAFVMNSFFHSIEKKRLFGGGITWLGGVLWAFPSMVVLIHRFCPKVKGKALDIFDLLVPGIGEMVGGSEREERYDVLLQKIKDFNLKPEDYWWYLNLRKFGSVKHSGFGLGFERLIMYLTGVDNIRDVIPYPRTPNNCNY